ncbi:hypothetical protein BFP72_02830 [Reichenbachiella sp. 5M10]|uniref:hypothetical protein n=1 Tax=Reichenbachiella sp. 5M10 TaxID=1889772 RepID=UPI000C15DF3E|nr:hypothetical protein [Reichenbachiella sp. 5M10]PIB34428.1 hypothetical protein BFP72_02830 [Reichenbachiella sp. 5M10]
MKNLLLIPLLALLFPAWGQTTPHGIRREEGLPVAALLLKEKYNVDVLRINYGGEEILSGYYDYKHSGRRYHGLWSIRLEHGAELARLVDVQYYQSNSGLWKNVMEEDHSAKEHRLANHFIEELKNELSDPKTVQRAQEWFFYGVETNVVLYNNATAAMGKQWFEDILKGKQINWKMSVHEVKKVDNGYEVVYIHQRAPKENTMSHELIRLFVTQLTDNPDVAYHAMGQTVDLQGTCQSIRFESGLFVLSLEADDSTK